jgi:hypothetical protein
VKAGEFSDRGNTQLQKAQRMKVKQRKVCLKVFKHKYKYEILNFHSTEKVDCDLGFDAV